ncbi:MAG: DUF4831 family protein [Bacteroidales bacterium]
MLVSKKIFYLLGMLSILVFSCNSSYQVMHVSKNTNTTEKAGFYYALPKTFIKVNFIVDQQEEVKGPYSDFAKKYFGLNNVIAQNSMKYKIKAVNIETYAEADSSQYYFVECNDSKIGIQLNRLGNIKTVNPSINASSSIQKQTETDSANNSNTDDYPELFKMYANSSLYEKTDTFYKPYKVYNSIIFEKIYKTSLIEKPTEQKVKEIADLITKIKDNRFSLLIGDQEVNDKKSIEFMYTELQNLENEYMKLFTGITLNHTLTYQYIYLPEKDFTCNISKAILCKFSAEKGIIDKSMPIGDPIYIQTTDNKYTESVNQFNNEKKKLQKGKQGFYYRMPAYTTIDILSNNILLQTSKQFIAQLGVILSVPNNNSYLRYDENTGGLREIQIKN